MRCALRRHLVSGVLGQMSPQRQAATRDADPGDWLSAPCFVLDKHTCHRTRMGGGAGPACRWEWWRENLQLRWPNRPMMCPDLDTHLALSRSSGRLLRLGPGRPPPATPRPGLAVCLFLLGRPAWLFISCFFPPLSNKTRTSFFFFLFPFSPLPLRALSSPIIFPFFFSLGPHRIRQIRQGSQGARQLNALLSPPFADAKSCLQHNSRWAFPVSRLGQAQPQGNRAHYYNLVPSPPQPPRRQRWWKLVRSVTDSTALARLQWRPLLSTRLKRDFAARCQADTSYVLAYELYGLLTRNQVRGTKGSCTEEGAGTLAVVAVSRGVKYRAQSMRRHSSESSVASAGHGGTHCTRLK